MRLNPLSIVLFNQKQQPLALCATLKRQKMETLRTLAVVLQSTCGQHTVRGWVHAYRLSAEQAGRARQKCRQRHKKGARKRRASFSRGALGADHPVACDALGPDDHGPLPLSLASGNRDKTLEKCARCGCVASKSDQSPGRGVAPWQMTLCLDA